MLCINRQAFEDVWVGLMKHSNSSVWYTTKSSKCTEKTLTLPGELFHERQCAVLNMSGPSHSGNSNLTYADSCTGRELGFVCVDIYGEIPSGKFLLLDIIVRDLPLFPLCMKILFSIKTRKWTWSLKKFRYWTFHQNEIISPINSDRCVIKEIICISKRSLYASICMC